MCSYNYLNTKCPTKCPALIPPLDEGIQVDSHDQHAGGGATGPSYSQKQPPAGGYGHNKQEITFLEHQFQRSLKEVGSFPPNHFPSETLSSRRSHSTANLQRTVTKRSPENSTFPGLDSFFLYIHTFIHCQRTRQQISKF